jgi:hypothetical protein
LKVWYLKIRPSSLRVGQKYKHVRGGKQSLYRADTLTDGMPAVICEGELDALLLAQEVEDLSSVITLASASSELNLATWGLYLLRPSCFILAYDMDKAGNEGAEKLAWLHDVQRLNIPILREGDKDLTDFHKSGGILQPGKERIAPERHFVHWPEAQAGNDPRQYWIDLATVGLLLARSIALCLDIPRDKGQFPILPHYRYEIS